MPIFKDSGLVPVQPAVEASPDESWPSSCSGWLSLIRRFDDAEELENRRRMTDRPANIAPIEVPLNDDDQFVADYAPRWNHVSDVCPSQGVACQLRSKGRVINDNAVTAIEPTRRCCVGRLWIGQDGSVRLSTRRRPAPVSRSAFAGFRFPAEVITVAVRWYLRYGLSYRDVEELLAERGVEVDHVTVYRWVQRFTPLFADAARFARHAPGDRWFVDETYVKVNGVWRYVYRAVDQHGQVIDVLVSARRDGDAARRFFRRALTTLKVTTAEVVTDEAPVYPRVLDELVPAAWHHVEQYANNRIEADHGRLKHRLRPMRGLRTDRTAQVIIAGLAFMQNLRRGHYELATETPRRATSRRRVHRTRPSDLTDGAPLSREDRRLLPVVAAVTASRHGLRQHSGR